MPQLSSELQRGTVQYSNTVLYCTGRALKIAENIYAEETVFHAVLRNFKSVDQHLAILGET